VPPAPLPPPRVMGPAAWMSLTRGTVLSPGEGGNLGSLGRLSELRTSSGGSEDGTLLDTVVTRSRCQDVRNKGPLSAEWQARRLPDASQI
jgi:hypothetical protein